MNANVDDGLILAVNTGSSSLKLAGFRIVDGAPKEVLRIGIDLQSDAALSVSGEPTLLSAVRSAVLSSTAARPSTKAPSSAGRIAIKRPVERDGGAFVVALLDALHDALPVSVTAVAHRVVHGGEEQQECVPVDDARLAALRALSALAPLHQPSALAIIDAVAAARPALPQFACLDTAFHADMPAVARDYALPQHIRARYPELHAYGFHGLSCRSVVERLRGAELPARLIIAHLGSGASVTAVRAGHSIATSMGFSALDGLPMATRPGRIDPGALLYLLRQEQLDADALEDLLYRRSGLLGMSGISGDMRVLLASDDADAQAAVDFFVYRAVVEIGALAAALGGLDALVFTGGIGEHASSIRARVIEGLRWLNADMQVHVVPCDEETVMVAGVLRHRNCQKRQASDSVKTRTE